MNDFKFSVAMCVYGKDSPKYFKNAVDSILNQTCKPDEVVLVIDGPVPENLCNAISEYDKLTIFKLVWLKENQGHGNARRIALENCSCELVALMDADDISVVNRFEKQIKMFRNNHNLDIVGGNISEFIDIPINIVGNRIVPQTDKDIKKYIKKRCPMNQVTVMCRKSSVQMAGGYQDWYCNEDYYLWLRMYLHKMNFANLNEILVNVRVGEEMYQRRGGWQYFKSEAKLQNFMFEKKIILMSRYIYNVAIRFIVQVLMPNKIRGWIFKTFARK